MTMIVVLIEFQGGVSPDCIENIDSEYQADPKG